MTREARIHNGVKIISSINGVKKVGWTHAKNENGSFSYSTYKKKLKMN